jgi:toxin ParE1/3/4
MAFHISEEARRDLLGIWSYIAEDSETAADALLSQLYDHFELLGKSIFMGRRRDDVRPGYRSIAAEQYVVLYRVVGGDVEIAHVIHGKRDLQAALEG